MPNKIFCPDSSFPEQFFCQNFSAILYVGIFSKNFLVAAEMFLNLLKKKLCPDSSMFKTGTFLLKDLISNQNTVHRMGESLSEEKKQNHYF